MRLMHPIFDEPIFFEENKIQVLVIEPPELFTSMITDLFEQSRGNEGPFVLSKEYKPIDCGMSLDIMIDYFNIKISSKKATSRLLAMLKSASLTDYANETTALSATINKYIGLLLSNIDYPLVYDQPGDISPLLKAYDIRLGLDDQTILENLIDYMQIYTDLSDISCFIFVNLKRFFTKTQLELFYKTVLSKKYRVLLLENVQSEPINQCESTKIVDADLCILNQN